MKGLKLAPTLAAAAVGAGLATQHEAAGVVAAGVLLALGWVFGRRRG